MDEYGIVMQHESMQKYSTFGIGGTVHYLVKPLDEKGLVKIIDYLKENNIKYVVIGNGSNVIIDDEYFDGAVIKLDKMCDIKFKEDEVTVEAGYMLPRLCNDMIERGYTNLAFASMIPGSIGGSVVGNAGAYGHEILEYVKCVKVLDKEGHIRTINKDKIEYSYRDSNLRDYIIISATFSLEKGNVEETRKTIQENAEKRKATQPLEYKNVGSIFRNPENDSAGRLIDEAGLKGKVIGGAMISVKHANFIVNVNNASFQDIMDLIDLVKKEIKEKYNIDLVLEPRIIKWSEL